jgi:chorismate synthase
VSAGSNTFGKLFRFTTFGESHGPAMGVVIDGCPAGVDYNEKLLLENLAARRPGSSKDVSGRDEKDQPEILSGVFENKTLGTPIAVTVKNTNQKSQDYDRVKNQPRTGHADDMWSGKFGQWDHRGGGRASARETVNWVMAGSFAQMFCQQSHPEMTVKAQLVEVGGAPIDDQLSDKLAQAKESGESYGGVVKVLIQNPPRFLGEPIFQKSKSELAHAFMTINACNGVEYGQGFKMAAMKGTEAHSSKDSKNYGGVRGGMTTGEEISFRLAFKPTSSILDIAKQGRHDPCVAVRAVPVAQAMTWAVLADLSLQKRLNQLI